jgi:membrane-bound inhibitor of C-type lysozyme
MEINIMMVVLVDVKLMVQNSATLTTETTASVKTAFNTAQQNNVIRMACQMQELLIVCKDASRKALIEIMMDMENIGATNTTIKMVEDT